jgi:hypothetical protein
VDLAHILAAHIGSNHLRARRRIVGFLVDDLDGLRDVAALVAQRRETPLSHTTPIPICTSPDGTSPACGDCGMLAFCGPCAIALADNNESANNVIDAPVAIRIMMCLLSR